MPYISEKIKLPRNLDRRVKITEEDKEVIKELFTQRVAIRQIARMFPHISRRSIQFIIYPERLKALQSYQIETKHHLKYYDTQKNTVYMRRHRQYKQKLYVDKVM